MVAFKNQAFAPIAYRLPPTSGEDAFSRSMASFKRMAVEYLKGGVPIREFVNAHYAQIWAFRIECIRWLVENPEAFTDLEQTVDAELAESASDPRVTNLFESVAFAVRAQRRAARRLMPNRSSGEGKAEVRTEIPNTPLHETLAILRATMPDPFFWTMSSFLHSTLDIEFGAIVALTIEHDKLFYRDKIDDTAIFVRDSGQQYSALVRQMSPPQNQAVIMDAGQPDAEALAENQLLAELDLESLLADY